MLNQFLGLKKKKIVCCVGLWEGVAAQLLRAEELWRREPLAEAYQGKKQHDPVLIESCSPARPDFIRCGVM